MKKTKKRKRFAWLPAAEQLKQSHALRVFGPYLERHWLWQFNRRTVAGGAAVGLFFGILIPFMQIFFAVVGAMAFRVNVPVAVACTFITNPLTFPPIYYLAYRLGDLLLAGGPAAGGLDAQGSLNAARVASEVAAAASEEAGWLSSKLMDGLGAIQSMGLPLAIGLLVLSVVVSGTAYLLVRTIWSSRTRYQWRSRRAARTSSTDSGQGR